MDWQRGGLAVGKLPREQLLQALVHGLQAVLLDEGWGHAQGRARLDRQLPDHALPLAQQHLLGDAGRRDQLRKAQVLRRETGALSFDKTSQSGSCA